jgi:acyl carrier protein
MEEILKILEEIKPNVDFAAEEDLVGSRILDSLSIMRLMAALNDEFDIELTVEDLIPENFVTVQSIYDMVTRIQEA